MMEKDINLERAAALYDRFQALSARASTAPAP